MCHVPRPGSRLSVVGAMITTMRDLDDLIADIDQLEAEQNDDGELRPLPGESPEAFRARMLAEFDALNALEEDGGGDPDPLGWDAWRWTPPAEPDPLVPAEPPSYVIDPEEIHTVLPRGGPLTTWIGGRRLGTLNPAAA